MTHTDPYTGTFPTPTLPDLGVLARIIRCRDCGGWQLSTRACTPCTILALTR